MQVQPFDEKEIKHSFLETSTFDVMFPRHREKYIREVEEYIKKALHRKKLEVSIDYQELVLSVATTNLTRDPYVIFQGRDLLKLVARGVPLDKAIKVFEDGITCDIISLNYQVRNKATFVKRRERLIGPHGNTIKSLELLTGCALFPYGNTLAAIGEHQSLKEVRRVALKCMENVHPIYEIKRLMVKRELAKDPLLKNENWERYLPQYKKTHSKKRKSATNSEQSKSKSKSKSSTDSLLPEPERKKKDIQLETGEYFTKKK
ncbi:ribosomal RNA assembly protein [Nematocida homosporus]|uniref:ribosomal RNA assembly protein n=1 Tax=Nematocida homosporus TaxID=1912981 RepID=UPI00221FF63F|nr:ribosomal RNA assembly protein [Nematocida homosporus]KAI5185291.1 ribosomal RNA assembly protein [Nematocida homosporus]